MFDLPEPLCHNRKKSGKAFLDNGRILLVQKEYWETHKGGARMINIYFKWHVFDLATGEEKRVELVFAP